jgi:hypothetical protein
MNMFATFKERAQASMRDVMSTATELASSAMENVKVCHARVPVHACPRPDVNNYKITHLRDTV